MRPIASCAIATSLLLGSMPGLASTADTDAVRPTYHRLAGSDLGKAGPQLKPRLMQPAAVEPPVFGLHAHYDDDGKLTMQCEIVREARAIGSENARVEQEQ